MCMLCVREKFATTIFLLVALLLIEPYKLIVPQGVVAMEKGQGAFQAQHSIVQVVIIVVRNIILAT